MFSVPPSGRHTDVLVTPLTVCLREAKNSECQPADTPRAFQSKRVLRWPACVEPKNSKCQLAGSRYGGGRSVHSSGVLLREKSFVSKRTPDVGRRSTRDELNRRRRGEHVADSEVCQFLTETSTGIILTKHRVTGRPLTIFQSSSRAYLVKSSLAQARMVFASGRGG